MGKVAILGSGNGGCAYSAYLGKRGHEVHLWDSERFKGNLDPIAERGGMDIIAGGNMTEHKSEEEGFGEIAMVTTDIQKAIEGVEVIMVVVPGFGIAPIAEQIAPYLKANQIVMLNPGQVLGSLEFLETLRKNGNNEDVTICEGASNIFACRRVGPTKVRISAIKNEMELASIPSDRIKHCISKLNEFYPDRFVAMPNILYTGLNYNNLIVHPAGALLNMGRIEFTKGDYDFYWEGLTPGVCRNIEAVDEERLAVAEKFGCKLPTFIEINHAYYGHPERKTIYDFFSVSEVHGGEGPSAPQNLQHRYISEDIPFALVAVSALGSAVGVETPTIDALITVASKANQEEYRVTGRSLKNLRLDGLNREGIINRIETGK